MVNMYVHQDRLTMLSASVELFPAKMFKHACTTACRSVITCYKSCRSVQLQSLHVAVCEGLRSLMLVLAVVAQVPCNGELKRQGPCVQS